MFGGSQSLGSSITPRSSESRSQRGFLRAMKGSAEGGGERFGEMAIVLFIGGVHTCGSRGAERRAAHGIATVVLENLQA